MKSTAAVLLVTAFAVCVFAIDRIPAAQPAASAPGQCTSCCNQASGCEHSHCQQGATAAAAECPAVAPASIAPTTTAATPACCHDHSACCGDKPCSHEHTATSATAATACPKALVAKTLEAATPAATSECGSCKSECTTACATQLQRTGLEPYRIEPPDALTILVPVLEPTSQEARAKLTSMGIVLGLKLPFGDAECEQVVRPDGRVAIPGIGDVYVSGMTVEEAKIAVMKKILETCPVASRAAFAVIVNVSAKNSKQAYIVLQGSGSGDTVCQLPVTKETCVNSALRQCTWPQPIEFASAKLWIARPGYNGGPETVLDVTWDAVKGQATCQTNHALLPGDRLYLQLQPQHPPASPPTTLTVAAGFPVLPRVPGCAVTPTNGLQHGLSSVPCPPILPSNAYVAVFPEAIPSPFASETSPPGFSPSIIATQAYLATTPLRAPAPACQSSDCTVQASPCCSAPAAIPAVQSAAPVKGLAQVLFNIELIQDRSGSLKEFESLQGTMPIFSADSEIVLPTLRVLQKHGLIRSLSSPRVATVVGRPAVVQVGCECASDGETNPSFHGRRIEVAAHELGGGLVIEFQFKDTTCRDTLEVATSLVVAHGQTVILRTTGSQRQAADVAADEAEAGDGAPTYIAITPQLVR